LSSLFQPAAFLIVIGGTLGAVLLQSGMKNFLRGLGMATRAFFPPVDVSRARVNDIALWSSTARREGLLSLDRYTNEIDDPFVQKGLRMVVDGIEPDKLREILDREISSYEMEQRQAARIWDAAGGYAPTVGILGAVLGLIQVMENLADPSRLGAGIAVAFVATVYGVGFANLVFLPIGARLKAMISRDVLQRDMLADAFVSIANGDSPRVMSERMAVYLRA
jgi:chemotaxis protein MotA